MLLQLAPAEAAYVAAFLARLRSWDERAAVRAQARGAVLGVYGALPMDALALIVVPLAEPVAGTALDGLDATVSAGRLRDILGDVALVEAATAAKVVRLPDPVTGPPSLGLLPPRGGWSPGEEGLAGALAPLVDAAVAGFRADVPASGWFNAELVAEATWDADGFGGVPMRALHAARLLGFLSQPDAQVRTATAPGWRRLVTPAGQVFVRSEVPGLSVVPAAR